MAVAPEYLRTRLRYDEDADELIWLPRVVRSELSRTDNAWNTRHVGKPAGKSISGTGYRELRLDGRTNQYHRVLWAVVYGEWWSGEFDHADRNPLNNHPSNLRKATKTQNNANHRVRVDSVSRFKGVQKTPNGKWRSRIRSGERGDNYSRHIGCFDTPEEASAAYMQEARRLFGQFASIGG